MVKISIDGKFYEVRPEKNLLETCLSLGIDIPHFCFHPALGSVGACRLCAVKKFKDKDDAKGRIVMSCMEPVAEGLIVSVEDPEARAFRASVIESLMLNHPHDCPVCDEGGECHLQDMTIMTGHNYRRSDFPKRTYQNQDLGPFIYHEMNRCIQCYRCVRFYRDYAGGRDLNVFASKNHVYFGRHEEGPLENEFSGNLVEVCPTGVFTDKTLKNHFTRKWDLTNAPSVCIHCSVGCNTIASERYGSLRRIMSRYNGAVNGHFICDRGRFGYEFVNDEKRIRKPKTKTGKALEPSLIQAFSESGKITAVGSPRASLESNYALMTLAGSGNFYHGISKMEFRLTGAILDYLRNSGVQTPSLKQMEKADAILILGEDVVNTAPMIALAVRQAARNVPYDEAREKGIPLWNDAPLRELAQDDKSPVFILTPFIDSLDEVAEEIFHASPGDIADLSFAIAEKIDSMVPGEASDKTSVQKLAGKVADSLKNAKNPLIISGVSSGDEAIVLAAFNIATALKKAGSDVMLSMVFPECNSLGLSFLKGKPFEEILTDENNEIDILLILENDLYRRAGEDSVNELFKRSRQVIVIDHLANKTTQEADILLPSATFAESEGTLVSNEGRAQRYYKAMIPETGVKEGWRWIDEIKNISTPELAGKWNSVDDILESLADELPLLSKLRNYKPAADFRMLNAKMPRQTRRYSGRTAMHANVAVSEQKLPQDQDSPLAFSMEGVEENPPSSLVPFYWTPGWNSVQALYSYLDDEGSLKGGDPGIRLIEPLDEPGAASFRQLTRTSEIKRNDWLIVPVYSIFGGEELSSVGSSISQKIQDPFVLMNQKDAEVLSMNNGDLVGLEILNLKIAVKVRIENTIREGMAGLSVNLPGMPFVDLPGRGKFHKL